VVKVSYRPSVGQKVYWSKTGVLPLCNATSQIGPKSPNERGNVTFAGHLKTRHGRSMSPTVAWPGHVVSCDVTMQVSAAEDTQLAGARGCTRCVVFCCNVLQHVLMLGFSWHLLTDCLYLACAACLPGGPYVLLALITAAEGKAIIFYRCNLFILPA